MRRRSIVALCIVVGAAIAAFAPGVASALDPVSTWASDCVGQVGTVTVAAGEPRQGLPTLPCPGATTAVLAEPGWLTGQAQPPGGGEQTACGPSDSAPVTLVNGCVNYAKNQAADAQATATASCNDALNTTASDCVGAAEQAAEQGPGGGTQTACGSTGSAPLVLVNGCVNYAQNQGASAQATATARCNQALGTSASDCVGAAEQAAEDGPGGGTQTVCGSTGSAPLVFVNGCVNYAENQGASAQAAATARCNQALGTSASDCVGAAEQAAGQGVVAVTKRVDDLQCSTLPDCDPITDTDGDGRPDRDDACPSDPGPSGSDGCGDQDADGIGDASDQCRYQAGRSSAGGCPDADGDGVRDFDDGCPNAAGPAANGGCPSATADSDGDGLQDGDDICPVEPGDPGPAMWGCPDEPDSDAPPSDPMERAQLLVAPSVETVSAGGLRDADAPPRQTKSRYFCGGPNGWMTVRNSPSDFVIGNCDKTQHIDLSRCANKSGCTYMLGFIYGSMQGCGWVFATHASAETDGKFQKACAHGYGDKTIARSESGGNKSGLHVPFKQGVTSCKGYVNAKPWEGGEGTGDTAPLDESMGINWRYKTPDGNWVMARIDNEPPHMPRWLFLKRGCLPDGPLPGERAV